jgi:hypothetical protein
VGRCEECVPGSATGGQLASKLNSSGSPICTGHSILTNTQQEIGQLPRLLRLYQVATPLVVAEQDLHPPCFSASVGMVDLGLWFHSDVGGRGIQPKLGFVPRDARIFRRSVFQLAYHARMIQLELGRQRPIRFVAGQGRRRFGRKDRFGT